MEIIQKFIDLFLHLDLHLASIMQQYGGWTYLILFTIIFCETGLVVMPILPGDSLLFATGALVAVGNLKIEMVILLLVVAAILGDAVNYAIGYYLGPKVLSRNSRFLKKEYLDRTHRFYEKYGGKTIVFARFIPIIRTFAPFLAGVGRMSYWKFGSYNVIGGVLWIAIFTLGGYFFGNLKVVRHNFTLVVIAIILISVMPAVIEMLRSKRVPTGS